MENATAILPNTAGSRRPSSWLGRLARPLAVLFLRHRKLLKVALDRGLELVALGAKQLQLGLAAGALPTTTGLQPVRLESLGHSAATSTATAQASNEIQSPPTP